MNATGDRTEAELRYDEAGLRTREGLLDAGGSGDLDLRDAPFYPVRFSRLEVAKTPGKLRIEGSGDTLEIRGDRECLDILAHNLRVLAPGAHAHVEWHENHPYLDADCRVALVAWRH